MKRAIIVLFKSFIWILLLIIKLHSADNWLMDQRNASRSGYFVTPHSAQVIEHVGVLNNIVSKPELTVYSSGRVVENKYVFALQSNELVDLISAPISSGIVQLGDLCFFGTVDGKIHALNLKKKELLWSQEIDGIVKNDPLFFADMVYFVSEKGQLLALDINKGKVKWGYSFKAKVSASPALNEAMLILGDHKGQLNAFEWSSGKIVWTNSFASPIKGAVSCSQNNVYLSTVSGFLYSVSLHEGKIQWQKKLNGSAQSSQACSSVIVAVGTQKGFLHIYNTAGQEYCYSPVDLNSSLSTPIIGHSLVYIASTDSFFQINSTTGDISFAYEIPVGQPKRTPVYGNQHIYLNTISEKNNKISSSVTHKFKFKDLPKKKELLIPYKTKKQILGNLMLKSFSDSTTIISSYTNNHIEHKFSFECDFFYSDDALYLFARIGDVNPSSTIKERDGPVVSQDSFMLRMAPHTQESRTYIVNISSHGIVQDRLYFDGERDSDWNISTKPVVGDWIVNKKKIGWTMRLKILFKDFKSVDVKSAGGYLKFNYKKKLKEVKGKATGVIFYNSFPSGAQYKFVK